MHSLNPEASRFLEALAPDGELTFQTFDESPAKRPMLTRVLHGPYLSLAGTLAQLDARGASAFVMVNQGDCRGREAANVIAVRALFVDLDGAPLGPVLAAPLPPRIVVQSSPRKWHCYWPASGVPLDAFSNAQKMLAKRFGGDLTISDLPRVMRVPGYLHRKREPVRSTLERCDAGEPFKWPELVSAFGFDALTVAPIRTRWQPSESIPEGQRNRELFKVAASWRRRGTDREQAERDLARFNRLHCRPPLNPAEVVGIVASAWRAELHGNVRMPVAVATSAEFQALSAPAKVLMYSAYLMADNEGRVMLTAAKLRHCNLKRQAVSKALREVKRAGLLELHRPASFGQRGGKRLCAIYRVTRLGRNRA